MVHSCKSIVRKRAEIATESTAVDHMFHLTLIGITWFHAGVGANFRRSKLADL